MKKLQKARERAAAEQAAYHRQISKQAEEQRIKALEQEKIEREKNIQEQLRIEAERIEQQAKIEHEKAMAAAKAKEPVQPVAPVPAGIPEEKPVESQPEL